MNALLAPKNKSAETQYCSILIMNQSHETVNFGVGSLGPSEEGNFQVLRNQLITAVGAKTGRNYGTMRVQSNNESWLIHG
jgi:hypothetical protein